jgi:NADH-quinone oxidoreductase subunit H
VEVNIWIFLLLNVLKVIIVTVILLVCVAYTVLLERKVVGRIQNRWGPSRVGPFGLLQPLVDGLKLFLKEDLMPTSVYRPLYILAPIIALSCALMSISMVPFGADVRYKGVDLFQISDVNIGLLILLGITGVGVYGIALSGWASNNKYSLLGALRASAQVISYELALGLSLVGVVLRSQSLRLRDIVNVQATHGLLSWNFFGGFQFLAFFIYLMAAYAETNRAPFDLPEAESELVAGYSTEYSGMRYLFFFFAEWANVFVMSGIASALFLGGWQIPGVSAAQQEAHFALQLAGAFLFLLKSWVLIFVVVWIRWTLPRVRIDQMMNLCWKWFVPLSFGAFLLTALWVAAALSPTVQLASGLVTFAVWAWLMIHFIRRVQFNVQKSGVPVHLNPFL